MNRYLIKAKKLKECGFWMAGIGNFDITDEELAQILEWIEKDDFFSIEKMYLDLEKKRL